MSVIYRSPNLSDTETTLLLPVYNEVGTIEAVISEFYEEIGKKVRSHALGRSEK